MRSWKTLVAAWVRFGVALPLAGPLAMAQFENNGYHADRSRSDAAVVSGDSLANLPRYSPTSQVSGVIRTFGNNYIPDLMRMWEEGFRKIQPGVQFETRLPGSEAAMAGLYRGVADLAFIGRESYPSEVSAFEQVRGYRPLGIEISSGSFQTPHKTFALMVFVNKDNPLAKASLEQIAQSLWLLGYVWSTRDQGVGTAGPWRPVDASQNSCLRVCADDGNGPIFSEDSFDSESEMEWGTY